MSDLVFPQRCLQVCVGVMAKVVAGAYDGIDFIQHGQSFMIDLVVCSKDAGIFGASDDLAELERATETEDMLVNLGSELCWKTREEQALCGVRCSSLSLSFHSSGREGSCSCWR